MSIKLKAKIEMQAKDMNEMKLLAGAFQDTANLIADGNNNIKAEDIIFLLQKAKENPNMILNALKFIS